MNFDGSTTKGDTRFGKVDTIALEAGTGWQFDEVRIGTSFASVAPVPEPSTLVLLGLGATGLLACRRAAAGGGMPRDIGDCAGGPRDGS
jgi:hypothetical protein